MSQERETAIHEAGHAVAHVRLEIDYGGVTIVANHGRDGAASAAGAESVCNAAGARAQAVAYCCGYGALIAAGVSPESACLGADDDFEHAMELIEAWRLGGSLGEWKAQAVALMSEPRNRKAVQVIADELLDRRRLDADFIDVLVELADGTMTREDVDRYLRLREHSVG